jgi:hypothetical protein
MWHGESLRADPGSDPDAVRVMTEVIRGEQWRITSVVPGAMQRERVGAEGGSPIGEAMYVQTNAPDRCIVELQARHSGRRLTLTVRGADTLESRADGSWFTAIYHRPR